MTARRNAVESPPMVDLHTHSFLSDGHLLPAELIRRAEVAGYEAMVVADHVDFSNVESIVPALVRECTKVREAGGVLVRAGAEVTHVHPSQIAELVARARELGAEVVLVHGETIVEPVYGGTNRAAIEAGCDVLAHPGLIAEEEAALAAEKGVLLEITARKGHCLTNGHVAAVARKAGAKMSFGTDAHDSGDLCPHELAMKVLLGAGLSTPEAEGVLKNSRELVERNA